MCNATRSRNEWAAFGGFGAPQYLAVHCGLLKDMVIQESCLSEMSGNVFSGWKEKLLVARAGLSTVRMILLKVGS